MTTKLLDLITALKVLFRQLYLSVTSSKFYIDVHRFYKGYGVKYVFTLSFISSLIYILIVFDYVNDLKNYFAHHTINSRTKIIEYVINQLPIINYDGQNILIEAEAPFYLYNYQNSKIGAIDPNGELSYKEKMKIPIIFAKNAIILTLTGDNSFFLQYNTLFGNKAAILNPELIREYFGKVMNSAQNIFIYFVMPLIIIFKFIINLGLNCIIGILIFLVSNKIGTKTDFKTAIRLAMFSSGILVLIQPFINLWILLIWTNFLVFRALIRLKTFSH